MVSLGFTVMTVFCKPPLLGAYLLCGKEWSNPIWKWFGTLLIAISEFVVAMQSCINIGHFGIFSLIPGLAILWGRCQEFMNSKGGNLDFLVKGYRQLQVQEKIHNSSYRSRILPIVLLTCPVIQILSGFALIALFHQANLFQLSIFLTMFLDAAVCGIIVVTFASSVYIKAEVWINNVKYVKRRNVKSRRGKEARYSQRVLKSFRPLRLEFGNNFVGRLTPLVMQEFCISQTASLLLLDRGERNCFVVYLIFY